MTLKFFCCKLFVSIDVDTLQCYNDEYQHKLSFPDEMSRYDLMCY